MISHVMNRKRLFIKTLFHNWKSYVLLILAVAVSTAVMVGAMMVGNSMSVSLERSREGRLGLVEHSLYGGDRFLTEGLVKEMGGELKVPLAGLIQLPGTLKNQSTGLGLNRVVVNGVDDSFWSFSPSKNDSKTGRVAINQTLAERLSLKVGDTFLLKLSNNPMGDSVMSESEIELKALELKIESILTESEWGNFNLAANQLPPYNVFIPLEKIQQLLEKEGRINLVLAKSEKKEGDLQAQLDRSLTLNDLELRLEKLKNGFELRSSRIFLEESLNKLEANDVLFTYLVNSVQKGDQETPYPLVVGSSSSKLKKNEIILTKWMAEDLSANKGDEVVMNYFVLNDENELLTASSNFLVRDILDEKSDKLDASMMPDYPGLKDSEHCRDWDVGFEIDLEKIREKDEEYWETHQGTPKAMISIEMAQSMWNNRYGDKTAMRFLEPSKETLVKKIESELSAEYFGLSFVGNRAMSEQALAGSMDFSGLFMGFSFFIFIAVLSLTHLLFKFLIEEKKKDDHLLAALGFTYKFLKNKFISEFLIVSIPGAIIGVAIGYVYTSYLISQLNSSWSEAIGDWNLVFVPSINSILMGSVIGVGLCLVILLLSLKNLKENFVSFNKVTPVLKPSRKNFMKWLNYIVYLCTALVAFKLFLSFNEAPKIEFFIFSFLILSSFLIFSSGKLNNQGKRGQRTMSRTSFMFSQMGRRKSRSLAVLLMLSCGAFMMISLEVFRMAPDVDTSLASSGSGGFQLIVDLTRNLDRNLNHSETQKKFGLELEKLKDVEFYPLRRSFGEDASCLNLNRAQRPNLFGVDSDEFALSERFSFASTMENNDTSPWLMLKGDYGERRLPVIGDQNAILYSLGKSMGDSIIIKDERGEELELLLVGGIKNSIFQSSLLVDEKRLLEYFPSISGFQSVLVKCRVEQELNIQKELNDGLDILGADVISTQAKMMSYNKVQNSYISIFQTLGMLGLVLGCAGLCLVVIHNINDRKGEFLIFSAMGQSEKRIQADLLKEHLILFGSGLMFGFLSGLLATWPILISGAGSLSWGSLLFWLCFMLVVGISSILFGYRFSLNKFTLNLGKG